MHAEAVFFNQVEADGLVKKRVMQGVIMLRNGIIVKDAHEEREAENSDSGQ